MTRRVYQVGRLAFRNDKKEPGVDAGRMLPPNNKDDVEGGGASLEKKRRLVGMKNSSNVCRSCLSRIVKLPGVPDVVLSLGEFQSCRLSILVPTRNIGISLVRSHTTTSFVPVERENSAASCHGCLPSFSSSTATF